MTSAFPVFDVGEFERSDDEGKRRLGRDVDGICRASGFLAIGNHGVPANIIAEAWSQASEFFNLPADLKQQAKAPFAGYPYGYLGPELEALAKSRGMETPPNLKESFNGGPLAVPPGMHDHEALDYCYAETIWPRQPDGFVDAWKAYYRAMEDLAARIMRLFAVSLELPEAHFDTFIDAPISALRVLNYPEQTIVPKPGQLRAGAHTDYGSLTILLPQADSKGLEILSPDGNWVPVPPVPDAFIINIGDLMADGPTTAGSLRFTGSLILSRVTAECIDGKVSPSSTSRIGTQRSNVWNHALAPDIRRNTNRCIPVLT